MTDSERVTVLRKAIHTALTYPVARRVRLELEAALYDSARPLHDSLRFAALRRSVSLVLSWGTRKGAVQVLEEAMHRTRSET